MMKNILSDRWQARFTVGGLILFGAVVGGVGSWFSSSNRSFESTAFAANRIATMGSGNGTWVDSAGSKKVSMATGLIDEGVEGLFALDHQTGNLFCWVLNPRNGVTIGEFTTNVQATMGLAAGGDPDFSMVTGAMLFQGGRGNNERPINSVVYVSEGNSGKVAGFSLNWNQAIASRNAPQGGPMGVVFTGTVRGGLASRDQ